MENTSGSDPTAVNQTTVERTEKNKYKIPILSDRETDLSKANPKMWWEQISEYIDLTYQKKLEELLENGTDSIDPHTTYHIKGDVIWALGPKAKHEIMRGQWGKELKDISLQELLKLFKKTFLPARNIFHSRAQFFNIKQEEGETLDEYWKKLVDIERKCEFGNITPEDIITYKFAASINDKKARDKFIKGPLKLQLVLETIELDNYNRKYGDKPSHSKRQRKNSSENTSEDEQVGYTKPAAKRKNTFAGKKKNSEQNCHFCGKSNWTPEHICPARKAKCNNCKKSGHFAKVCRSKTVNLVHEEETDGSTESWPEIDHIQSVNGINRVDFYKAILLVEGQPIEIVIDTGSPVTIIPPIINPEGIKQTTKCFVDVNKNPIKFRGEAMVEVKTEKTQVTLPILITEKKNTQPLLGLDWLDKLEIGLQGSRETNIIRNISTNGKGERIFEDFRKLFKTNHTIKDLTIEIQLKKDAKPIQQKGRPVPIHFQKIVKNELDKLIEKGHLEKADKTTENCFVSPAVITIKKDKSVKIALDSRKLNESCIKRKATMPNMEELISQISAKITQSDGEIWMSKIDLDYAYGQAKLSAEASRHCVFSIIGGEFNGHYRFKKGFYGLADIPTVFQEHIDKVLEFKTPVWLDDIICVTNGTIEEHERELREVLTKLQEAGYRASERKTELFKKELTWLGYLINQNGVKPIQDKTDAITKLKAPTNTKELKSFLGSIQHLSKFLNNLSKKTDRMRKLLKKDVKWEWTKEINDDFEQLKKEITEAPCLAHFDPKKDNFITTDACNTGLGATLWQKENGAFRPVAFASRFLTDCERKYAINELELLGVLWGLEYFRYYVYGKRINLLTDHQALQPLLKRNRAHKQYSARLTRWLDRLSHFDVNVQYTAGKNIPLTDYLSRHPIVNELGTEELNANEEKEAEEEFVINQIYGLFEFNRTNGSITQYIKRPHSATNSNQSQCRARTREQNSRERSNQTFTSSDNTELIDNSKHLSILTEMSKLEKVNGIDLQFIFKKRGHSPETGRLRTERLKLLQPNKTRIVGKGSENERIQDYRPTQQERKETERINILIYNRFFNYCETIGTTPLKEFNENVHESWISNPSDNESQVSHLKTEKCPISVLKKFKRHESVNLIRLKQTAKLNTLPEDRNQKTAETIRRAEKDFALDLPLLVEETAQDTKILDAIIALEAGRAEDLFYPYRPHREHLGTRFGLLFYNDRIVIPETMRSTIIAMLHSGHVSVTKMDKSAEAFWWPGLHREIREKAETCPSCRTAGKNLKTQIPQTEVNRLEILTEPGQEIQLDFAGPIKSKSRGDVYILVAVDRFSKWPTAQICKRTDSRTVIKFLTKYCADNGTPRTIRTDNGSCFKSQEFKIYCKGENIKRIRSTPNLHTGTGLVERTIRTIKSLTRANLEDGLTFEESVTRAIKTIRQTMHSTLKMTPFQLHYGRKPRTPITNLIGQPTCLLTDWKKTITNYILAQPAELQVYTIQDSDGELADYLVLNESRKRGRSVSGDFKNYKFFEKETKPNAMKCRFKTDKILTAAKETKHTITTTEGKLIHKKLASKPLKFQPSKKPDETRKPTTRCKRCGRFSNGDLCDTHKRLYHKQDDQKKPTSATTFPTMPAERPKIIPDITTISTDSHSDHTEELPSTADIDPELTVTADIRYASGQPEEQKATDTPAISSPIGCSTERVPKRKTAGRDDTPTGSPNKTNSPAKRGLVDFGLERGGNIENIEGDGGIRRSNRIKTAKRVVKMGGIEYF